MPKKTRLRYPEEFKTEAGQLACFIRVNPKFVQELVGHTDVSLTLNVYSHVLPDMGDAAAGAMNDALE
jgi:integrase